MSQIPAFSPVADAVADRTPNQFSSLSSEDFIRIIFTELSSQDPFEPNDSAALLEQLSSIRGIEADLNLMDQMEALVLENQLASAANMIGRTVTGRSEINERVTGRVVAVAREGDSVTLELESGHRVPMSSIESVNESEAPSP
jgi:flagellar hook assembly protein FlgD